MPDGTKVFGKAINSDPEKYFTPEIMEQLEAAARKEFMYGGDEEEPVSDNRQDDISEPDSQ